MNTTLAQVATWLTDSRIRGDAQTQISRVHTDTRTLQPGDLFVAIKGDNFDANDFLAQAKSKGASAALAHPHAATPLDAAGLAGIEVPDTRRALGELARGWRNVYHGALVAVTGSNGKTTVTQMLLAIFTAHVGVKAHATRDSFNNDIGLPLTLLGLTDQHTHAAIEMGMNHPGEIEWLASLAQPTVALVNNAQREHQEFMGTVEAVAIENATVFDHVRPGGIAVFPANDAHTPLWRAKAAQCRLQTLSFGDGGDVSGSSQWQGNHFIVNAATSSGPSTFSLSLPGQHNVQNALAAMACALAAGVPLSTIEIGLSGFAAAKGRSRSTQVTVSGYDVTLIDDSYNANPDSVLAAIDVLSSLLKPSLLILGDMGEVGEQGPQFHAEVGQYAAERGIDRMLCLGELAQHSSAAFNAVRREGAAHLPDIAHLLSQIDGYMGGNLTPFASVLVKGSRFMRMERVVTHIEQLASPIEHNNKEIQHAA